MAIRAHFAHQRAERCFALARSTTFDGERETAIATGMRIVSAAGLDLDAFEIPGRERTKYGGGTYHQCGDPLVDERTGRPFTVYTSEAGRHFDMTSFQQELDRWVKSGRQKTPPAMWKRGERATD